jgi:hypothetical protein
MQTCRHADMQTCRHADMQTCRHADMQTCRHADMQTRGAQEPRKRKAEHACNRQNAHMSVNAIPRRRTHRAAADDCGDKVQTFAHVHVRRLVRSALTLLTRCIHTIMRSHLCAHAHEQGRMCIHARTSHMQTRVPRSNTRTFEEVVEMRAPPAFMHPPEQPTYAARMTQRRRSDATARRRLHMRVCTVCVRAYLQARMHSMRARTRCTHDVTTQAQAASYLRLRICAYGPVRVCASS